MPSRNLREAEYTSMRRLFLFFALSLLVLLGGCTVFPTPNPTVTAPTSTPPPLVLPTAPAGWNVHHGASFQISLPASWEQIALDEATLKKEVDAASSDNPHLADTLRAVLDSGQFKSFLFYAADKTSTSVVSNVSIAQAPTPGGTSVEQAERDYAQALPQVLKGAKLVAMETALAINGQKAGEIDYDLPLVNAAGQVVILRGVQYLFFLNSGDAYIVTVTGDASAQDRFVPLARQIGQSFEITAP
jgi:hypothetical protein